MTGIAAHIGQFLERRRGWDLTTEVGHSRDEYIALVGHEIRTPLTSIESYTGLMIEEPDLPASDRIEMLQVVQRNTGCLHIIIDKLLDIAGPQSGHVTVSSERTDLSAITQAAIADVRARVADKDVTFDIDVPDEAIVWGDPRRLAQVVNELLSNALDWADAGSRIIVTVTSEGPVAQLTVSNTGQVIPAAEHERIFQRFSVPAGPSRTPSRHGAGAVTGPHHHPTPDTRPRCWSGTRSRRLWRYPPIGRSGCCAIGLTWRPGSNCIPVTGWCSSPTACWNAVQPPLTCPNDYSS